MIHKEPVKKTIDNIQQEIIAEFKALQGNKEAQLTYLMDLGTAMEGLSPLEKKTDKLVAGCLANVWVQASRQGKHLLLQGDSDAIVTKGLLALLFRVFSGQPISAIITSKLSFLAASGLDTLLSLRRRGGGDRIVARIIQLAQQHR